MDSNVCHSQPGLKGESSVQLFLDGVVNKCSLGLEFGKEKHVLANYGDVDYLQGMSGTLNHSPSMDFSDPKRPEGAMGPHSVLQPAGVPYQQHSPLQHFVQVVVGNFFIRINYFSICRPRRRSMKYS